MGGVNHRGRSSAAAHRHVNNTPTNVLNLLFTWKCKHVQRLYPTYINIRVSVGVCVRVFPEKTHGEICTDTIFAWKRPTGRRSVVRDETLRL